MVKSRRATTSAVPPQDSTSPATPPYGFSDEIQPVPQPPPPPQLEDFDVAKGDLAPIGDTGNRWAKIKRHLSLFNLTLLT